MTDERSPRNDDTGAEEADFDGVSVSKTPLEILALYMALVKYDPAVRDGEVELPTIEPDDEDK